MVQLLSCFFGHCVVCPSSIYPLVSSNFWPLCCPSFFDLPFGILKLLAIVLSFLLRFTLWYLQTFGHCVVSPSSIYPLVSSNFWPLCCPSFFDLPFGILKLLAIVLSFLLRFTLWYPQTFGHCVVSPSSIYPLVSSNLRALCCLSFFDLPFGIFKLLAIVLSFLLRFTLWYLQTLGHCVVLPSSIYPLESSNLWPLRCLSSFDLPFGILKHLAIVSSLLLRFTLWYPQTFGHCVVSPSSIYPLVSSNFWPLCRLSFFDIPFGILKLLAIVLSLLFRFTLWHLQTFLTNGRHLSLNCL